MGPGPSPDLVDDPRGVNDRRRRYLLDLLQSDEDLGEDGHLGGLELREQMPTSAG